ncbi:MAG: hypothetical protein ABJC09_02755 [Terriglobia bacterium]
MISYLEKRIWIDTGPKRNWGTDRMKRENMREIPRALTAVPLLAFAISSFAQQYTISTYAGGAPPPTPAPGVSASIYPSGLAADALGNVFFASGPCVFKLDKSGTMTRFAGTCRAGFSGDGGPASNAQLYSPQGVAVDGGGNLYIADVFNGRIRKVTPAGIITTVAGNGNSIYSGDGGPATSAGLYPSAVAVDGGGNLYIAEWINNRIRKVTPAGIITTIAGNGTQGYSGDGNQAASAQLNNPWGVAVDSGGNVYIADKGNNRIRKVAAGGVITTVAGNGSQGYLGDGGPSTSSQLSAPNDVAVDGAGNLYVADLGNYRIRKVNPVGIITTVAGNGNSIYSDDGGPATSADLYPTAVALDGGGNLYIAESQFFRIRKVTIVGIISTVAGNGFASFSGDGGPATSAQLFGPLGLAVDSGGNLYFSEHNGSRIRKVTPAGIASTVAGNGIHGSSGDGGPATSAQLFDPWGVAVDGGGNLYLADGASSRIRKITPAGVISTVVGNGTPGHSGDGGPAISAQLIGPLGVAVDGRGNLYIADASDNRIRKVTPAGIITTVAGNGNPGYSGDGGPATSAQLSGPFGVAVDGGGNLYIADSGNSRIRKVNATGIISTVAGNGGNQNSGDGGAATSARLSALAVAVDGGGNLYIASDNRIRKVNPAGTITTVAGNDNPGYSGDGGPATSAELRDPYDVAVDSSGKVYIADTSNNAIRLLTPSGPPPALPAITTGGIVPAFGSTNTIQTGEWVSIYGTNFADSIYTWNGTFTTTLGNVSVTIDGKPAYLSYASPLQLNVQAPDDPAIGTVAVVVTTPAGTATSTVTLASVAPSFLLLDDKHVAAIILRSNGSGTFGGGTYDIVGPTGSSLGYGTVAAKAGDIVEIFAVGLGPTNPTVHAGQVFTGAAPTTNPVSVSVSSKSLTPSFAGLSGAGLYQINLTIPAGLGTGDVLLTALVGGAQTQTGVVISLQ